MKIFLRTILPVTATIVALTWQTACSSDGDDEATGGKGNGGSSGSGGSGGSSTGGKGGSATGGSNTGGSTTGGSNTGGSTTGGSSGAAGAGGMGGIGGSGTNECGRDCPDGQFCSQCFNPDDPDVPLFACIDDGTSC